MLSVIIPARNEADGIGETLAYLRSCPCRNPLEILVAEGGSSDATAEVARSWARVIHGEDSTRAGLMNAGANAAQGEHFLFLHADSFPPPHFDALIERALLDPLVVGGAFKQRFLELHPGLRAVSWINRMRYALTGNYYGDQGIFVRRDTFKRLGGFPRMAILEDLEFSRRMKRAGRTVLIPYSVLTSGRRFLNRGITKTFLWVVSLLTFYSLGFDTDRYAKAYRKENTLPRRNAHPRLLNQAPHP